MSRCLFAVALLLAACDDPAPAPAPTGPGRAHPGPPPTKFCPGMPGCEGGSDGTLLAGAAKVDVSPRWMEKVIPAYLERTDCGNGEAACGVLKDPLAFKDCGTDMLCSSDPDYPGPDADGSQGDRVLDYFRDCGEDDLCPGDAGWAAPDEGERNGKFDGQWIAGFSNNRPAMGIHDPLWARAFALQNGDITVAWVVIDGVGFFWNNLDSQPDDPETTRVFPEQASRPGIRQRVAALAPELAIDYVIAGSTHTHEAPDTLGQWGFANQFTGAGIPATRGVDDAWLFDTVIEGAAQAVIEAVRGLRPATAHVGAARTGAEGIAHDSRDPPIFDDTVHVLRLDDASTGETITSIVSWGSHPEVLWSENNLVSSDYVHYLREAVEAGLPAVGPVPGRAGTGGICVFLQAPLGGLITPGSGPLVGRDGITIDAQGFEKSRANGERVADVALQALEQAAPVDAPTLEFGGELVELPIDNTIFKVVAMTFDLFKRPYYHFNPQEPDSEENRAFLRTEVAILRLGRVTFVTSPGELFPELSVGFGEEWRHGRPFADPANPAPPDPGKIAEQNPPPYLRELGGGSDPDATFVTALTFDEVGYIVPAYDFVLNPDGPYFTQAAGDHYEETNSCGPETQPRILAGLRRIARWTPPLAP